VNELMDKELPHLEIERDNDVVIARLTIKSLDALITHHVGDALQRLVDEEGFRKVVINLKQVEYLISETLGRMVTLQTKMNGFCGELRLCHLQPFVAEKFLTTGLTKVFHIWDDEDSALSAAWD
jgi:anti-anti-sigma factor